MKMPVETHPNEGTFEAIFEACQEGIIAVEKSGIIILANKAAHKIFGYEPHKLIGRLIDVLVPSSLRKDHVKNRQVFDQDPSPRKMGVGRELMGVRKDGSEFPVEISLNQLNLGNGDHTVAFVIDITERRKIEEALKKSEEQLIVYATELENRVTERTEELNKINKELEEQIKVRLQAEEDAKKSLEHQRELNTLKSRFVSMASHEFRTPLSTILSSASLIDRYESDEHKDKRKKHITKIKSAINNLTNILNDFLSLSKLEEGKVELQHNKVNICELVKDIIDELEPIAKEDQKIEVDIRGREDNIESDERILKNIFINLISNAIKYSDGGKTIFIKIDFNSELIIQVKDQGMGIPQEDQKHMFQRFFRAKNATNIQGTGLGLNIVKKYLEMLGGDITFTSKLNEGTTFTITIPIK